MSDSVTTYDVFLSYNWRDREAVDGVAHSLKEQGLNVFLDRWYLTAGLSWPHKLEEVLNSCRAVAVFLGPHGMGHWQQKEQYLSLNRQTTDPTFPVIPVLLPGADPALGFLSLNTWIDLRTDIDVSPSLSALTAAVRREAPGPDFQRRVAATLATVCPYRGLRTFREEDATFFFGRTAFTTRLSEMIESRSFVALIGASGSGKSSVVRAGLVPQLRRKYTGQVWDVLTLVPGDRPLHAVAATMLPLLEPRMTEVERLAEVGKLAGYLAEEHITLRDVVDQAVARQPGTDRLLLVVDQWEELYTLCRDDQLRRRFVDELLNATKIGPLSVLLTLRGDFFSHALNYRPLADRLQDAVVNLGPMNREELKRSIVKPAEHVGLQFEPGLVERILDDVEKEPGTLPLLEFALAELWQRRDHGALTNAAYDDIGGVSGAIAQRAEDEFEKFGPTQQLLIRRIFTRLVRLARPEEGAEDTRRRAPLEEFSFSQPGQEKVELLPIAQALTNARLLVMNRDPATEKVVVDVAHEALIRSWERLRSWLNEDREFLLWQQQLMSAVGEWETGGKDESALLRGVALAKAVRWRPRIETSLNDLEREFIDASVALETKEFLAKRRRGRLTVAGLLVALLSISIFAFVAYQQRNAALRTISRDLAARAISQLKVDPELSVLLANEALRVQYTEQAEDTLRQSLAESHVRATMRGHASDVVSATFSLDGKLVVTMSTDNTVRVWNPTTGQTVAELRRHSGLVHSVQFSPDSKLIVTTSGDKTARVWEAATGRVVTELRGHKEDVRTAAFSPDGMLVVTGGGYVTKGTADTWTDYRTQEADYKARVWDVASGRCLIVLDGHTAPVSSAAFSPNGLFVVTASRDHTARVWDPRTGKLVTELVGHNGEVYHTAFDSESKLVLTASSDDTARVWEASSGKEISRFNIDPSSRNPAAFSLDGNFIVTANKDENAVVWVGWKTGRGSGVRLGEHTGRVESVQFSPDSRLVVTASADGTARVWQASTGSLVTELRGHSGTVWSATFSPDAKSVVTASADGTARVWDVNTLRIVSALSGHELYIHGVSFSPNGKLLITASDDGIAEVWDVTTASVVSELQHGSLVNVASAEFSPDSNLVVTASWDRRARVWEARTGKVVAELQESDPLASAAFSPNGKFIVTTAGKTARVWEANTGKLVAELVGHLGTVRSGVFSPDGKLILTASEDKSARVWDTSTWKTVAELRRGIEATVYSAAFSPDSKFVVTASGDRKARVWQLGTSNVIELLGHTAEVRTASFSRDGKFILTASSDGTARVWKASKGQSLAVLHGYSGRVSSAAFSPNDKLIAITCGDATLNGGMAQIFDCDVCGSVQDLLDLVHKRVTRQLTVAEREMYLPKL